jgi:hypothetical protein
VQCLKCGYEKDVWLYTVLKGLSRQCNHCKNKKYHKYVNEHKLNQIWRKYKKDFCSEWKTNFNTYAKFLIEDLGWKSGQYRISKKNKNEPLGPKNIKLTKKKQPE